MIDLGVEMGFATVTYIRGIERLVALLTYDYTNMTIEHPQKPDFDAVPIIDFALATTDPEAYFKQLKSALASVPSH